MSLTLEDGTRFTRQVKGGELRLDRRPPPALRPRNRSSSVPSRLEVRWPGGSPETVEVHPVDRSITIVQDSML